MELTVPALLAAALFFSLLATGLVLLGRGPSDLVFLFLLVFALFAGLRPLLFVVGLDGPYPDSLFPPIGTPGALTKTLLALSLYLALALLAIAVITGSRVRGWAPFFAGHEVDIARARAVTFVLTGLAAVLSVWLLAKYGGVGNVIAAAKQEKALAGMYAFRVIPAVGAIVAVATFIEVRRSRATTRVEELLLLVCALGNAFFVFLWGARSVLTVVGAMLILGLRPRRRRGLRGQSKRQSRDRVQSRERVLLRLLAAVLLVLVAASGLRMVRDTLSRGAVEESYATATVWRQVSVGTNSIYFDAAMLSFRDWPGERQIRNGKDFYNGLVGVVPRSVWAGKPTGIPPGKWFRQTYQPGKVNGWPMGSPALWYLNFGWWGLPAGGLVSGVAVGLVAAGQRRKPRHGFNTGIAIVTAVYVLPLGWDNQVPMKFVIWLVPLWLIGRYIAPRRTKPKHTATGVAPEQYGSRELRPVR